MATLRQGLEFEAEEHALFAARKGKLNVTAYQQGPEALIQGKDTGDFIDWINKTSAARGVRLPPGASASRPGPLPPSS